MRVCAKHREAANETLKSLRDGTEYDLCPQCQEELQEILMGPSHLPTAKIKVFGEPEPEVKRGRKRTA